MLFTAPDVSAKDTGMEGLVGTEGVVGMVGDDGGEYVVGCKYT